MEHSVIESIMCLLISSHSSIIACTQQSAFSRHKVHERRQAETGSFALMYLVQRSHEDEIMMRCSNLTTEQLESRTASRETRR